MDTNVVLDVLLERMPFYAESTEVLASVELSVVEGLLCSSTVTTIYYVARKVCGDSGARQRITRILNFFDVATTDRAALRRALGSQFRDFEDAVIHEAARGANADAIVTRDPADFRTSTIPVYTPEEFLRVIHGSGPA